MRAKTSTEHRVRQHLEAVYPGLDACVNFAGLHEAIVTDISGDKVRVIYKGGQVYETEARRGETSLDDSSETDHYSILLGVWDGGSCGSDHDTDIEGVTREGEQ